MPYSQTFSSFLCIGFLLSIANGFFATFLPISKIAFSSRPSIPIKVHRDPCSHPRFGTDRRFWILCAIKGKSNTSTTAIGSNSDKVKQMASFLSIQLLQKVMNESMKPEGESNMNLDAVERLSKALQMNSQPSSEASTADVTGNGDKADDTDLNQVEISATKPDATFEPTLSPPSENTEIKSDETTTLSRAEEDDTIDTPTAIQVDEMPEPNEKKSGVAIAVPVAEKTPSPQQIPEILRKPLEIVQSDIPPLRPESVPRKIPKIAETDDQNIETHHLTTCITEQVDAQVIMEEEGLSDEAVKDYTKSSGASLEGKTSLDRTKAEELFRRKLLKQKFELDNKETTQVEVEGKEFEKKDFSGDVVVENYTKSSGARLEENSSLDSDKAEELFRRRLLKQKFKLDNKLAIQVEGNGKEFEEKESLFVQDISDQEIEKYNVDPTSSVGIRAEAQSLNMKKPEVDVENPAAEFRNTISSKEDNKEEDEESHKGDSIVRNIDITPSDADPSDLIAVKAPLKTSERRIETIVALRQPKSFDEESKLAEKYAQLEKLEDRAYTLLCDLGMVEEHIDPRDPTYDHSNDDQYCEQRFLPSL